MDFPRATEMQKIIKSLPLLLPHDHQLGSSQGPLAPDWSPVAAICGHSHNQPSAGARSRQPEAAIPSSYIIYYLATLISLT